MQVMHATAGLITLTALSSYINHRYINLPKSIGLTLMIFFISSVVIVISHVDLYWHISLDIDEYVKSFLDNIQFNKTVLHGMLSFLLFAGSLRINVDALAKRGWFVLALSTFGVLISTIVIGFASWYTMSKLNYDLSIYTCLVFGALISPTDPTAILTLLKDLGVYQGIESKISGEALFNNVMGLVLFFIMCKLSVSASHIDNLPVYEIMGRLIWNGAGAVACGMVIGITAVKLMKSVDSYEIYVLITLSIVTTGYIICDEILQVSGVISVAAAGLIIGSNLRRSDISRITLHRLDSFWDLIDEGLNAVLFVLIGLEVMDISFSGINIFISFLIICIVLLGRFISILIPAIFLSVRKKTNKTILLLLTWGGLRKGISIALALSIEPDIPQRDLIISMSYLAVIFSILVQGLTIGPLVRNAVKVEPDRNLKLKN